MPVVPVEFACTPKCRSNAHYLDLIRLVSQSLPIPVILNYLVRCGNCGKGHDKYGRTLVQVCSALSEKWPIIDWLLKQKKVDINLKNLESGYTALHYSVFYGRIDVAVNLIKAGANTSLFDYDYLTYIDHVIRDTFVNTPIEQLDIECFDVYTMGENTNGSLGHSQPTAKKVPEPIDVFRRDSICIKKVKMDKYHTLFLSDNGSVYSCGFGVGGRLGHDNEEPVLIPKQIAALELIKETEQDRCIDIAVTRDCSYFLTEKGFLWSCGLNNYHQLGHPGLTKLLVPTKVPFRQFKERKIMQIACGRFHLAVLLEDGQLYTFGFNGGQLGHPKTNEPYIQQPLLVTKFNSQQEYVQKVICSDFAIVCYTNKGDIYVLNDYKYRKIVKHALNVTQLAVVGGKIESNGIIDEENLDDELKLFYVQSKKLFLYHERDNVNNRTKLCLWTTKQRLMIEDIAAGSNAIILATSTGQVYTVSLDRLVHPNKKNEHESNSPLNTFYDERAYQYLTPTAIPLLHRCRTVTTDRVGRSIGALQYYPTTHLNAYPQQPSSKFQDDLFELYNEVEHNHDITLQLNRYESFPAHKYILCMRSPYFRERIANKSIDHFLIENETNRPIDAEVFRMILEYIYTDKCPWLNFAEKIRQRDENEYQTYLIQLKKSEEDDIDDHRFFARVRQQTTSKSSETSSQRQGGKSKKKKKLGSTSLSTETFEGQSNSEEELNQGLDQFLDLARLLQLHNLRKRLEVIKQSRQKNLPGVETSIGQIKQRYHYTREALSDLHDVNIVSEDGRTISAHKCILTSRLEYFRSMFMAGWTENQMNSELKMPIPADLLKIIIDYLYTDTIPNGFSMEQLCQILVLADQLLIERLKQICEFHIANLITFRDATELLQFASTFNAEQLKIFVSQFICRNMATFLEGRLLDNLDQQLLSDLTKSYRNLLDCMCYRLITPYSDCPSLDDISTDLNEMENLSIDIDDVTSTLRKPQAQQKRKQQTKSRTSESDQINRVSPPKMTNPTAVIETVTPTQPMKWEKEEKWTSVSSKKGSKNNKATAANNVQVSPPKPIIPGAVYSQEEADRLSAAKRAADQDSHNHRVPTTTMKAFLPQPSVKPTPPTPKEETGPKNPWKMTTPTILAPVSLKSTPSVEGETVIAKPTSVQMRSAPQPTRSISITQPSPSQVETNKPWSILATSPSTMGVTAVTSMSNNYPSVSMASSPPVSFKFIQDQEARAHEALRQISNKSLETIQTEELAIQALHRLYNSAHEFDMNITIERVTPEIANPIWPRTSSSAATTNTSSPSLVLISQKKGQKSG